MKARKTQVLTESGGRTPHSGLVAGTLGKEGEEKNRNGGEGQTLTVTIQVQVYLSS